MRIEHLEKIKRLLSECSEPIVCNNSKLWKIEIEKAILTVDFDMERMRINNKINRERNKK